MHFERNVPVFDHVIEKRWPFHVLAKSHPAPRANLAQSVNRPIDRKHGKTLFFAKPSREVRDRRLIAVSRSTVTT